MPYLVNATLLAAGGLLVIVFIHAVLALKRHQARLNGVFAITALFAAAEAATAPLRFSAQTVPELILAMKISFGSILIFAILLPWFIREYVSFRDRWVPAVISAGITGWLCLILNHPYTMLFTRITGVGRRELSWGETISIPIGEVNPWFPLGDSPVLGCALYTLVAGVKLWRRGPRNRAIALTLGMAPLILFIYPHGYLVHMGVLQPPHLYPFGFLTMGLVMSGYLINEAARSGVLTREVEANERRWRTLLDNVSLLVAGCDTGGRFTYVNPFLSKTTGYEPEELLGKEVGLVLPQEDVAVIRREFHLARETGAAKPTFEARLCTKDGAERVILWSNVILRDRDDFIAGTLSVGSDITERRAAEKLRDDALHRIEQLTEQLQRENTLLKLELEAIDNRTSMIFKSDASRYVLYKIQQVASTHATVLIEGETGVGKELVAREIHNQSPRSAYPFVCVNCAAIPASLAESELFGHERGAFTSADRSRKGRFELADGGTLFLDEIGELGLDVQSKLLRVLQTGEYQRVGDSVTRKANVRVVAATNRVLRHMVANGRFRSDLFYRLNVYPISIPPLRERREDIPALVHHFTLQIASRHGKIIEDIPASLVDWLTELPWPGNVRELENLIERAVIMSEGGTLAWPREPGLRGDSAHAADRAPLGSLAEVERLHIERVLEQTNWKISGPGGAAEVLGLHPNTLRFRMSKLGISRRSVPSVPEIPSL